MNFILWSQKKQKYIELDLSDPKDAAKVSIKFIAQRLSKIQRCSGTSPVSVLNHSLAVYSLTAAKSNNPAVLLCALLHDMTEAFIGDVPSRFKTEDFKRNENELLFYLMARFVPNLGLLEFADAQAVVKQFDKEAWELELLYQYSDYRDSRRGKDISVNRFIAIYNRLLKTINERKRQ